MNDAKPDILISQVRRMLREASSVTVFTGAGISAESGVPTYRGADGALWDGLKLEDWATPEGYARNPQRVWKWYSDRRVQLGAIAPNSGHYALANLQRQVTARGGRFVLATQNIDGLHQKAGSDGVLELHGSLLKIRCSGCAHRRDVGYKAIDEIPPCPACGAMLRPAVVWFGEPLPEDVWTAAAEAAGDCEVFLAVGTSAVVYPAAGLIELAVGAAAKTIEVNLAPTPASTVVDITLHGKAGEILPQIVGDPGGS